MISDANIARQVSQLMLNMFSQVDESLAMVRERCPADEVQAYQTATGRVVGAILMDVLEPLYLRHPELKPANWDA
jgi:hypothetical protein